MWINWYQSKKPIPQKLVFSTTRFQSEKKLPYGSFFLRTKTFGHNTFSIALHVMKMDIFKLNYCEITNKNNWLGLMDKLYRQ